MKRRGEISHLETLGRQFDLDPQVPSELVRLREIAQTVTRETQADDYLRNSLYSTESTSYEEAHIGTGDGLWGGEL
jgi:hypothetical protein